MDVELKFKAFANNDELQLEFLAPCGEDCKKICGKKGKKSKKGESIYVTFTQLFL